MSVHTLEFPEKDYTCSLERQKTLTLLVTQFWNNKNYPALVGVTLACVLFEIDHDLQDEMYFLGDILDEHMEGFSTTLIRTEELPRIKELLSDY